VKFKQRREKSGEKPAKAFDHFQRGGYTIRKAGRTGGAF
jgi:hypothetical protein